MLTVFMYHMASSRSPAYKYILFVLVTIVNLCLQVPFAASCFQAHCFLHGLMAALYRLYLYRFDSLVDPCLCRDFSAHFSYVKQIRYYFFLLPRSFCSHFLKVSCRGFLRTIIAVCEWIGNPRSSSAYHASKCTGLLSAISFFCADS